MTSPKTKEGPSSNHLRPQAAASSSSINVPRQPSDYFNTSQANMSDRASMSAEPGKGRKKRGGRSSKKKRNRRQSFLPATEEDEDASAMPLGPSETPLSSTSRPPFYKMQHSGGRNLSDTSIDSEALLDHRDQHPIRARRDSRVGLSPFARRSHHDNLSLQRQHHHNSQDGQPARPAHAPSATSSEDGSDGDDAQATDRTPLLAMHPEDAQSHHSPGKGMYGSQGKGARRGSLQRYQSTASSVSSGRRGLGARNESSPALNTIHDVNNPPSVPNSPKLGPGMGYDDAMVTDGFAKADQIIDIDGDTAPQNQPSSSPPTPRKLAPDSRRHTIPLTAEEDVCFPVDGMSAIGEEEYLNSVQDGAEQQVPRRRRARQWPDLCVLEEWSREEKESRSEGIRAKKISEPVLVGGRLRPQKHVWHRTEEDAPYRFTYFNEEFPSTIHSQTISELLQPGQDFRELFVPDPPLLSDDDYSTDEEDLLSNQAISERPSTILGDFSRIATRNSSLAGGTRPQSPDKAPDTQAMLSHVATQKDRPKRYGERPTFWLDVLCPTDQEMRVISKAFGVHPLTAEDIMMQEAREKVELFPKYYFVNYRTFEQDSNSEDYLEPINMYVVVFPEGVLSFHFSMTPHPANVRRRIRQLKEYLQPSSDWISYALIDDITDVFAPLIHAVEEEVDEIDDAILKPLYDKESESMNGKGQGSKESDEKSEAGDGSPSGGDMLRRVGQARKKVMMLYRLLGNKADVIKGFAKRCNERWQIAPKSDIGLYLGDIQDHILTMTSNLSHYETLLSRAHSNFLAQMNIRMNERQEQTADVLGKLTVLGTIVLPMNIITGMWGMNVLVPGQDVDNLNWFWSITAGLLVFGISCFFIAKRVYGIV